MLNAMAPHDFWLEGMTTVTLWPRAISVSYRPKMCGEFVAGGPSSLTSKIRSDCGIARSGEIGKEQLKTPAHTRAYVHFAVVRVTFVVPGPMRLRTITQTTRIIDQSCHLHSKKQAFVSPTDSGYYRRPGFRQMIAIVVVAIMCVSE